MTGDFRLSARVAFATPLVMKHRVALGVIALGLSSSAVGCFGDSLELPDDKGSEIVFGISQARSADGKLSTSVGYEFLDVQGHGWSTVGYLSKGRSCWAERLDARPGQPRVEGGVATFQGAALPDKGIAVIANRADDLVLDAPAWRAGGEALTFEARGFAMPNIGPETIHGPSTELALTKPVAPAPDGAIAEIAIDARSEQGLEIGWNVTGATAGPRESVVASLVTVPEAAAGTPLSRGVELRCFFDRSAGSGTFPQALVARFAGLVGAGTAPIKGTLRIATHRQLTIHAAGGWTVYVVAAVDQRAQPFALQR